MKIRVALFAVVSSLFLNFGMHAEATARLGVCSGSEILPVEPKENLELALGSTIQALTDLKDLRLVRVEMKKAEAEGDKKGAGSEGEDEKVIFAREGATKAGFRFKLSAVLASADGKTKYRLTSRGADDKPENIEFVVRDTVIPECSDGSKKKGDLDVLSDRLDSLEKSKLYPDVRSLSEYSENAVVEIDAATGVITPSPRVKVRRGHYAVVTARNGWIADIRHEQSYSEGGNIFEGSPAPQKTTGTIGRGHVAGAMVPGGSGKAWLGEIVLENLRGLSDTRKNQLAGMSLQGLLSSPEASGQSVAIQAALENLQGSRSAWLRAGFRESVFHVTVIPYEHDGKPVRLDKVSPEELAPLVSEYTITMNAQKWGFDVQAGFVLAATHEKNYIYVNNADGTTKTIQQSSESQALPFPSFFVNFWQWEKPQWGVSLGLALDSEGARPLYALGGSYLFSRHGQLTVGLALVPEKVLPTGLSRGDEVPLADNSLQALQDEFHIRPFLAVGWSFGTRGSSGPASETEPTSGNGH